PTGGIGLASQSGALMGAMLSRGVDIGAGFSSMVSVGNQADLDLNDFFEYLVDDPATKVVCLYMEAVKDAGRFVSLLARAAERGKPVCICKSGRSEAGVRAAISHTASVAGAWPAFEATCRRWGVYLFESIYDLVQGAQVLNNGKQASGRGVAVFSGSGGGGALLADALESHGLDLPILSEATAERLSTVLPATHRQLPHDFGMLNHLGAADPEVAGGAVGIALDRAMADDAVGLGLLLLTTQPQQERVVEAALAAAARTTKPLLFVQGAGNHGNVARKALRAAAYGYFDSTHDALKVAEVLARRSVPEPLGAPAVAVAFPQGLPAGYLGEPQTRSLLEQSGIATTPWKLAIDADAAVAAARDLGGPVVIKAVSDAIVHKSDIGAVKLNLEGDAAVRAACAEVAAAAAKAGVPSLDGFLVTQMCKADSELILGLQHDPDFGPLVMIGAGGVLIELLHDVQLAPAPVSRATALAMLAALKSRVLLDGYRGRAPADLEQIADAIVRLGALAIASKGRLRELDVNPLFVVNGKIVAADARAVLA
ncbi:MAG: acetate--CoA ligase family protein, partial [Burkholderiaceae bacterium]